MKDQIHTTPKVTFYHVCVNFSDPLVELLLLLSKDASNLLRELNKVTHFCQILADATDGRRKCTAAGHAVGQLTLWMDKKDDTKIKNPLVSQRDLRSATMTRKGELL